MSGERIIEHIKVMFHVPAGKLTQYDLDTTLEYVSHIADRVFGPDYPIFINLDNKPERDRVYPYQSEEIDIMITLDTDQPERKPLPLAFVE